MRTASDVAYFDASALVKLVLPESETDALRRALGRWSRHVTSRIAVVEVLRAVGRRDPATEPQARRLLAHLSLLSIADRLLIAAAGVAPPELRSIDALHVASALRLAGALAAFVSYDERQLEAAEVLGIPTASPR